MNNKNHEENNKKRNHQEIISETIKAAETETKKMKLTDSNSIDLTEIQKKIKEKQLAIARIEQAKQKANQRKEKEKQEQEQGILAQELDDQSSKAKGGLNVAYHPILASVMNPNARLSKNRTEMVFIPKFSTVKANQNMASTMKPEPKLLIKKDIKAPSRSEDELSKKIYFDPLLKADNAPTRRIRASFKFIEPGRMIEKGNELRNQEQLLKLKMEIAEAARKAGIEKELELVPNEALVTAPPPAIEWWDAKLLPEESYSSFDATHGALVELINNIVQHPVPIEPPQEEGTIAPQALKLTKKELKKQSRLKRLEVQRAKQDKIRLGLLAEEKPRLTKSNFMRVLGQDAVLAPSMIEKEMAKQVEERQQKHRDLIAATKLTEEERREKKDRKLREDTSVMARVAVFKIGNMEHKKHLHKVSVNAQQHKLTGVGILHATMNLVIVEGGPKGIKAYKNLMLNRINWQERPDGKDPFEIPNTCTLVWEGEVKNKAFYNFRLQTIETYYEVDEFVKKNNIQHYWNAARTYIEANS